MRSRPLRLFFIFSASLLVLAPADAQQVHPAAPADTVLWLHVDGLQDFGISPQTPPPDFVDAYGVSTLTQSNRCLIGPPAPALLYGTHHTWYGVPGPVAYRTGPDLIDRGLAFDLELDADKAPTLVWHMAGRIATSTNGSVAPAGTVLVPDVILRATMRENSAVSIDHRALDTGALIAQAETRPATLSPLLTGHPDVTYHDADGTPVYTFRLALDWKTDQTRIPAATAFNLRVDLYLDVPLCDHPDEATLMPDLLSLYTAPSYRPSLTLGVQNPLWIEELRPVIPRGDANGSGDTVQIQAIAASPWGAHDLASPTLTTDAETPAGSPTVHHGLRALPPPLWTWNLTTDDTPHTVHLETRSLGGATADATARFDLGTGRIVSCQGPGADACTEQARAPGPRKDSPPAPTGAVLLATLASALFLARRRT